MGYQCQVFLVKENATNSLLAMKVVSKDKLKEKGVENTIISTQARLTRLGERDVIWQVESRFIVKLHYAFDTPTELFFVTEYVEGGELLELLTYKRAFTEDWAQFYCAELVLALQSLHEGDVIYRDLKTSNIMIDREGHIKLVDFGFSKFLVMRKTQTFYGTPSYMAPEVLRNQPYTTAVDWWSLVRRMDEQVGCRALRDARGPAAVLGHQSASDRPADHRSTHRTTG
jgi:serine/threonine protein kinase